MATYISRALYRARQFFGALNARVSGQEEREASALLGPELSPLFQSMSVRDRRHCFDVYALLKIDGCENRAVLTAALLHDCGKGSFAGAPVRLWHRVTYVMLAATAPGALRRLARGSNGLGTLQRHAKTGVALAREHGAPEEVADLMLRMDDPADLDERVGLLRDADDAC